MAGGDVHITSGIKDIIIRAGQHIYPQENEEAIADIPGIRKGGAADIAGIPADEVVLAPPRSVKVVLVMLEASGATSNRAPVGTLSRNREPSPSSR